MEEGGYALMFVMQESGEVNSVISKQMFLPIWFQIMVKDLPHGEQQFLSQSTEGKGLLEGDFSVMKALLFYEYLKKIFSKLSLGRS